MTITAERPVGTDLPAARRAMIDSQLRVSGVTEDFVLAAMNRVRREDFVPAAARGHAYIDRAIPLENGRALAAPLFHGRLLAEAAPSLADKALLISCGSGYLAALVQPLVGSLEVVDAADATAKKKKGGYSLLLIDGAIEELPEALVGQLAEGGRIVTGLVTRGVTRLAAGCKLGGTLSLLPLAEIGIPVLREFTAPKRWSF
jgi:protein-L-isoaspartate(D-aspartate) O-methyltransferase